MRGFAANNKIYYDFAKLPMVSLFTRRNAKIQIADISGNEKNNFDADPRLILRKYFCLAFQKINFFLVKRFEFLKNNFHMAKVTLRLQIVFRKIIFSSQNKRLYI